MEERIKDVAVGAEAWCSLARIGDETILSLEAVDHCLGSGRLAKQVKYENCVRGIIDIWRE
jgi:hypothetical protein